MIVVNLREVWDYFTDDVKRVFTAIANETDRARTKLVLGALSDLSDETADIVRRIEDEAEVPLIHPETIPEVPGECPDQLEFTPCVKEALNFYRIHQLKPITTANLSLRLLQIGTGDTVMKLEENGHLSDIRTSLEQRVNS